MIFGLVVSTLGIFSYQLGLLARVIYDRRGMTTQRLLRRYRYTRTVGSTMVGGVLGALATLPLLVRYVTRDFTLVQGSPPPLCADLAALCTEVDLESYTYANDPSDAGLEFDEVVYRSPLGDMDAWLVQPDSGPSSISTV